MNVITLLQQSGGTSMGRSVLVQTKVGPLKELTISDQWYGEPWYNQGFGIYTHWAFRHVADPRAWWFLFCAGKRYSDEVGDMVAKRVFKPGLKLDGDDCLSIVRWLPEIPCEMKYSNESLETGSVNGRRAVFLNRFWCNDQTRAFQTEVDAAGDGTIMIEMTYKAPPEIFDRYLPDAKQITDSAVWRPREELQDWIGGHIGMFVEGKEVGTCASGDPHITSEEWFAGRFPRRSVRSFGHPGVAER